MSSVKDVIEPIEQSNAITTIKESNASNHILTNLSDPTEDALKKMYTLKGGDIAASMNTQAAANLLCPLFLTLLGFEPSLLLPGTQSWVINVTEHGEIRDIYSRGYCSLKFDIGGHTLELERIKFSLLTSFFVGKVIFLKVKADNIPPLVRRLFLEKVPRKCKRPKGVSYNVKGRELLDFVKDDEKWKNINDVDAVRVCLLLMAEHASNVPYVKQELSYVADDVHTMALDKDEKVCTDEPKPGTTLHSFIPTDGDQFMALDEDAKVCIYEESKPSTSLHSDILDDDVQSIPFDDDAKCLLFFTTVLNTPKETGAEYMNEELRNGSHNKEPLSKQPYVPFRMHTCSRDYQLLDKQPEDKLVHVNAKVDSLLVPQDTVVVDETADKQVVDAKTMKMINV
uniref:Uncharacterized protein n=1 Tax=Tanacetum cinerariifolium TaxID=118510 RepID=A0A6L2K2H7_TANCI|nr:hypothetical protein [Tanacetum cinerariifolium]